MKIIIITLTVVLLTLLSCNNFKQRERPSIAREALDTITTTASNNLVAPNLFETAFIKGTKQKVKESDFSLYGITIGKIKVVSGHLIVCDPLHIDKYGIPFTQLFPTGEFPVQLSIAKLENEELTAFARIKFSDEPVTRWEFALQKDQQPLPVGGEEMHTYGIDGGVVIFVDEAAAKVLDPKTVENFESILFKEMEKNYREVWKYVMYNIEPHNLACFSTGLGDGRYATYIGFDATGKPCRLLTDFNLFDWRNNEKK